MRKFPVIFLIFLGLSTGLSAEAYQNFDIHTNIVDLEEAIPPKMIGRTLFMTYSSDTPVRYVGVSFAHESYRQVHPYSWTTTDSGQRVFYITIPVTDEAMELKYRIVVDGLWIADPSNPRKLVDSFGMEYSLYAIPENTRKIADSPVVADNRVHFYYYDIPGQRVYVSGDFNSWDPFMHRLNETEPGFYTLTLRMREGIHFYYYVVNGERIRDPMNDNFGNDRYDMSASYFNLDKKL